MEKTDQKKVQYMTPNPNEHWIDTRLNQEEMDFLRDAISEENKESILGELAGNISKSEYIKDKDNWFYETVLKKLTEKLFYRDWNAYHKYHVEKENPSPKFEMDALWVNYQKQHEFNPIHEHSGLYSFVIFMKIPTHWKEQHALPISANSTVPLASDFAFVWSRKDREDCITTHFRLSSEDEGRMLFFPAWLQHMVYPFYECEEERVTISGNIILHDPNRPKEGAVVAMSSQELQVYYEEKEKMLEIVEKHAKSLREELKSLKKAGEKVE